MELAGVPLGNLCPPEQGSLQVQLLGLTSEQPALQLSGHSFSGQCEDVLGTSLFFQHDQLPESDRSPKPEAGTQFVCKSRKKIVMQPVIFVEKAADSETASLPADSQATNLPADSQAISLPADLQATNRPADSQATNLVADSQGTNLAVESDSLMVAHSQTTTLAADVQPSRSATVTDANCSEEQIRAKTTVTAFGDAVNYSVTCSENPINL